MNLSRRALIRGIAASTAGGQLIQCSAASATPAATSRRYPYVQMDVFTSQRLEGNQLVVFTDARGLTDAEMLALARETNLQETTFVFPRDTATDRSEGAKVRIFYPAGELPFAGHPTLGTANVLRMHGTSRPSTILLDLKAGKIPVVFHDDARGAFGEMTQLDPVFGKTHDRTRIAQLIGLRPDDLDPDLPIQTVSTGLGFVVVPLRTLKALQSLHLDFDKNDAYLQAAGENALDFHYVTRETGDSNACLRARNIDRFGEDPATGSASGCTAAWMVKYGVIKPEELALIRQGVEANRPSEIFVRASKTGDRVHNVRVGGYAVKVMEGVAIL
ncbi:PhzF family phenazine biosynthesis protein [Occallatibacter riparius]|uniref:PhzF family phenazine biosynthesis protein n=1 Tax=Occallatibacter riparius TaxID=1002689 RepID=A0A9J7BVL7_9BACT|nr:PhzF family phenazine biosynthesis protein [Occallatibacter riparius]UWZ86915.1 PhzF family phenazine biosynthesis protein [Occallatibacter riparius]